MNFGGALNCGDDLTVPTGEDNKYSDTVVCVIVRDNARDVRKTCLLHRTMICSRSRFFHDALARLQMERRDPEHLSVVADKAHCSIELEADSDVFDLWVTLILTETIVIKEQLNFKWKPEYTFARESAISDRYRRLFELFKLCELLRDTRAMNKIIDAIVRQSLLFYSMSLDSPNHPLRACKEHDGTPAGFCNVFPLEEDVMFMYRNTQSNAMRRLLIDMWAYSPQYCIERMSRPNRRQDFDLAFVRDLSVKFATLRAEGAEIVGWTPGHINSQHYHEPPDFDEPDESVETMDAELCGNATSEIDLESDASTGLRKHTNGNGKARFSGCSDNSGAP